MMSKPKLTGERFEIDQGDVRFPDELRRIPEPPERLFGIGNVEALCTGLAIVGARKATPYGLSCASRFARQAAEKGVNIISGGALGCDSQAHKASLEAGGSTVVFLGGGCDELYPARNRTLFQSIVDSGGAIVSENEWGVPPMPYHFRRRNRLIAGLARAVLIVEAGLPSGTFSTADEALAAGKDVLVVPGAITSSSSRGSNRLLYQGAIPIVDDETFEDVLWSLFGSMKRPEGGTELDEQQENYVISAIRAEPLTAEAVRSLALEHYGVDYVERELSILLAEAEINGLIARQPDGKWTSRIRT